VRASEHAGRNVDAIDTPVRSDRRAQEGQVPAGSTADLKHTLTRLQLKPVSGLGAESRWLEKQVVE
jgi:hypothetical protein